MKAINDIPIEKLRDVFDYDPNTGILKRKRNGMVAGWITSKGHIQVRVLWRSLLAHRVAFAVYHGRWPSDQIDHINGIKSDNRISNLREASGSENCRNISVRRDSRTGVIGVGWYKKYSKYRARIAVNGKSILLGFFKTLEDATAARIAGELKYHGKFSASISRELTKSQ